MQNNTLEQRLQKLEDMAALKKIVDTFSNLADKNELAAQSLLFTEDAQVDTYFGDQLFASLKGRKEILETFTAFLANFESGYHLNGQFTAQIDGDRASAEHYCLVVLISTVDGQKTRGSNGVAYQDEYVRQGGQWWIAKRTARFMWRDQQAMPA